MLDPRMSGLEPFLAAEPGPDSGVMMLEYTAHAAAAEARSLAAPMAVQSVWASLGVESHASLAATAATRTARCSTRWACSSPPSSSSPSGRSGGGRVPAGAGVRELFDAAAGVAAAGSRTARSVVDVEAARDLLDSGGAQ